MADPVTLHGYGFSVYTRIARMVLEEKGVAYTTEEVDPFAERLPDGYRRLHPFGRVPALCHGAFTLYETGVIARYVDGGFDGPALTPSSPKAMARMAQVVAILDQYGYWPMVRQVFAHGVFRPRRGEAADPAEIAAGLEASGPVLSALEAIASEGLVLTDSHLTLADCHLAPMMDYFAALPAAAEKLSAHPSLSAWWARLSKCPSLARTDPWRLAGRSVPPPRL
jgi:glutathione S-transferase